MSEILLRFEVQNSLKQIVENFMNENNIPPHLMEDALSKILLELKDKSMLEYLLVHQNEQNLQTEKEEESEE